MGAAVGGWVTFKVAGPYWERAKLSAVQPLLEARLPAYGTLWELTEYGPEEAPKQLNQVARTKLANDLRAWYFEAGAGLLLSASAQRQWDAVRKKLLSENPAPSDIRLAMSCLRTRLKQDVHVHDPHIDVSPCVDQPGWSDPATGQGSMLGRLGGN